MLISPGTTAGSAHRAAAAAALLSLGGFLAKLPSSDGHLYMMKPMSRNLWGTAAFQESSGQDNPFINYCPHCYQSRGPAAVRERGGGHTWPHFNGLRAENGNYLESDDVAKRHGVCGDPEQTSSEDSNRYGLDNSNYPVLETYAEGGILEVKIAVSTYHQGHIEMFLCNVEDLPDGRDGVLVQSCFNKYPLDRDPDDDPNNSPVDPNQRGRFILDPPCRAENGETDQEMVNGAYPGDVATARFLLPAGVTCERCVVQMVYYTGNSCSHQGYEDFTAESWPSACAPTKADWIDTGLALCGVGDAYPEEFWNCADIQITPDGDESPTPESSTTSSIEVEQPVPTPAPNSNEDSRSQETSPAPMVLESRKEDGNRGDYDTSLAPTAIDDREDDNAVPSGGSAVGSVYYEDTFTGSGGTEYLEVPPSLTPVDQTTPATSSTEDIEIEDCGNPVGAYEQCGGGDYDGPTCCIDGYECQVMAECYSECRPSNVVEISACSHVWGQCGGIEWGGSRCCSSGSKCVSQNDWYSQCLPE